MPLVFYVGCVAIAFIIIGYIISELLRPLPKKTKAIQQKKHSKKIQKRHEELQKILEEATLRDEENNKKIPT